MGDELIKRYQEALEDCGLEVIEGELVKTKNTIHNVGMTPALALFNYAIRSEKLRQLARYENSLTIGD